MSAPFVIFGLPRSRTAWLSRWLSYQGRSVGHDIGIEADSCQGFFDQLCCLAGTAETGAMFAHRLVRAVLPDARFVTIRRPVSDVLASLGGQGITGQDEEIAARDAYLDDLETAGALRVSYAQLGDVCCCADLFEHLLGVPFDFRWWRAANAVNVQVDMPQRLARLAERKDAITELKAETREMLARLDRGEIMPLVAMAWEPVASFLGELKPLGERHWEEVNNGALTGHPFRPDGAVLTRLEDAGIFKCLVSRMGGRMVGYLTWNVSPDPESEGIIQADQGGWYVDPDPAIRPLHLGRKMLDRSIADLGHAGIHNVLLHHQLNGRGANLGAMFARMGAVELQHRYLLSLGGAGNA